MFEMGSFEPATPCFPFVPRALGVSTALYLYPKAPSLRLRRQMRGLSLLEGPKGQMGTGHLHWKAGGVPGATPSLVGRQSAP